MDYSIIYTVAYSVLMSLSACAVLVISGMKRHYSAIKSFLMLCIPKTVFCLIRFYFENFESNYFLLVILLLSMMIFDVMLLFTVFDCPMIQKVLYIGMMDMAFMPVLLVKQAIEARFLTAQNTLEFESFIQLIVPLICYAVMFACMVVAVYFLGKIINKINFEKPIFDIFGMLALFGYLIIELIAAVMFWQNLVGRENQFIQYFNCALIYCCTMLIMYFISNYFTKKRLEREIEVLNTEKEREFRYYNLMRTHNEEIRKIKHDLNGHFGVLSTLVKDGKYDKMAEYITSLSDNYNQIKRVVYTSNLMADAVITSAVQKCEQKAIRFDCEGILPDDCFIDDVSLTCIFSNILDNAVEACEKAEGDKYIKLSVFNKSDCLVITCKNSKSENIKPKENLFKTTKTENGHGFGIKIIKEIVAGYDGVVTFEDNGAEFEISLLIPLNVDVKK
ncbi:MAG: GHKL domain-containing protein [Clostridia bacterium]|nr:GHKL domain-containing protein [Clostridia bacterium]